MVIFGTWVGNPGEASAQRDSRPAVRSLSQVPHTLEASRQTQPRPGGVTAAKTKVTMLSIASINGRTPIPRKEVIRDLRVAERDLWPYHSRTYPGWVAEDSIQVFRDCICIVPLDRPPFVTVVP